MSAARRRSQIDRSWDKNLPSVPVSRIDAALYGALREAEGNQMTLIEGKIHLGVFTLTDKGLIITQEATQDEWQKLGEVLFRLEGSIQWLIGDWLVYGSDLRYGDLLAIAGTIGRDYKTLRNYMVVSRGVELSQRRDTLSFGHHETIAHLPPPVQETALAYAVEHNMSVAMFRKWIRQGMPDGGVQKDLSEGFMKAEDSAYHALKKLTQRDVTTLRPEEKGQALDYIAQMERWLAAFKTRLDAE